MSEFAVISYSVFIASFGIVVIFFSFEDDDDQGGGKMMPIPLKR
ncbi:MULTISPECIES: hypothetical protein [Prochlorococcus]|uniref:Uncharacterized protein n=1 Tax=Prochlorococcus marinus (strain SARG / CCMP1375 / SS120) TaxID=167539 RepID=Q7VAC9_PROMA|nr:MULTISPECIES: hypothetical protein [Prochlorococcus]AAQ00579.1 Predicted protein family PM-23 [Prochlorococcus marinus subsp. marinus str. CCMP1375]KGG10933.1 putative protein family PM-23 [Prochlorococcus marinus str. LG]KGG20517.1 putative protein family PM-23 [Prochlorococcus marinus str. SS2]KGG24182.1 putative protein family PM-23 [Prochlorococcus marinus str. SS35]KGG31560.1 putative protein family PM-23 [Prochlorococcus marinus str. SS51]